MQARCPVNIYQLFSVNIYSVAGIIQQPGLDDRQFAQQLQTLKGLGVIKLQQDGSFALQHAVEWLDHKTITAYLDASACPSFSSLDILLTHPSTNNYILDQALEEHTQPRICLAEHQQQGRGRNGKSWHSPFAQNIYLSIAWDGLKNIPRYAEFSLVAAVAVIRALKNIGLVDSAIKWPNDIFCCNRKIGGILIETRASGQKQRGHHKLVVGIGLNVKQQAGDNIAENAIDQPWTSVEQELAATVSRNELSAGLIHQLLAAFYQFQETGFHDFEEEYQQHDLLMDAEILVQHNGMTTRAKGQGIDHGALLVEINGQQHRIISGSVTLAS